MQNNTFEFAGGPSGILLVHGFSGSPVEMRGLGTRLAADGHAVSAVRLAGHTGNPADLAAASWRDWLDSVEQGYEHLQQRCVDVYVCGFSVGGALAVLLSTRRRVRRLALLATPARLSDDWRVGVLPVVRYVMPWFYPLGNADFSDPFLRQKAREHDPDIDLDDPAVQQRLRTSVRISTAAIDQAARVVNRARGLLPRVTAPTLVLQGRQDETVPANSAEIIYQRLGSTQKRLVWMENTGHQLLVMGPKREEIYTHVATFFNS